MSGGFLLYELFFRREVGVEEGDEDDGEGNDGNPDRLADYEVAEYSAHDCADGEEEEHAGVARPLFAVGLVSVLPMPDLLGQADADLADVVCDKGCRNGDALRLAEGVVLHGGKEVYDDLGDLHRRGLGDEAQYQHGDHLDEDQNGVPAHEKAVFDGVREELGDKCAEDVRRDGDEIVQRLAPLC